MGCREIQPWTVGGLVEAFFDLAIAYFLLCLSAFVFLASKVLKFFWVYLPCPCNGFLGYVNRDLCLHKLLIDGSVPKILAVRELVKSRFPFDVVWSRDQNRNLNRTFIRDVDCDNEVHELEGDAYSCSFSSRRLQNLVDRESGCDAKGKKVMVLKKRSGIRRSRRASSEYGKVPSLSSNDNSRSVARIFPFSCDDRNTRETSGGSSVLAAGIEDVLQDDVKAETGDDMGESIYLSSKLSLSIDDSKGGESNFTQKKAPIEGNETDTIRVLQEALEKEKASCAALYLELEKERAAAATAADEAMAMIYRLQKEKASIEMEVKQYQRMMEEKFVYDEEEMDVLKEILLRREMENHFLEKEVEGYRQMSLSGNEESSSDLSNMLCELARRPLPSLTSKKDPVLMLQQTEHTPMGNVADSTSQYEASFVEKQIHPNGRDYMDNVMCHGMTTEASATISTEKNLYWEEEEPQQDADLKSNFRSSIPDTEPAVYDIHVIDGKTELWKEESRSSTSTLLNESEDFPSAYGASGLGSSDLLQGFSSTSRVDAEPKYNASSLDMCCGLSRMEDSPCKTLVIDSTKNYLSAVNSERLKTDTEVDLLMERLQMLEDRKGKLNSSSGHGERQKAPSKLSEEIRNPLCEVQQLRGPSRQASLPPLSPKVSLKKRRCQSSSSEAQESARF